jgi:hypothetical protein
MVRDTCLCAAPPGNSFEPTRNLLRATICAVALLILRGPTSVTSQLALSTDAKRDPTPLDLIEMHDSRSPHCAEPLD